MGAAFEPADPWSGPTSDRRVTADFLAADMPIGTGRSGFARGFNRHGRVCTLARILDEAADPNG